MKRTKRKDNGKQAQASLPHAPDKSSGCTENRGNEKKRKCMSPDANFLKEDVQEKYLVTFPDEFFTFWEYVKSLAGNGNPCGEGKSIPCFPEVFHSLKSLRLVGIFDYLAGHLNDFINNEFYLLHYRFATDLPEIQTFAVYTNGRFGYWRDEPDSTDPLVVHIDNTEHFPTLSIVGVADPTYMIAHLIGKKLSNDHRNLLHKKWIDEYGQKLTRIQSVISSRRKNTFGVPFHGIGVYIKVVDDVGYRTLVNRADELKDLMMVVQETEDETVRERKKEKLMTLWNHVQFANDEMDFGMGLELGHDLFWSNYDKFDNLAKTVLTTAYKLLKRDAFNRILTVQMGNRRRDHTVCGTMK